MNKKLNHINECYTEAKSAWQGFFDELQEDYRFYMSDQWSAADLALAEKKKFPALNLNYIKKTIDLVSGYERQNKGDIKVLPIEGSDEFISEIMTKVIKWTMLQKNNEFISSQSFKDAIIGGMGFLEVYMDFDKDPINGDIRLRKISPFDMLLDPYFTSNDLSDADYIIRHKKVSKTKLKVMYPKMADKIEALQGGIVSDDIVRTPQVPSDRKTKMLVVEYWHKVYKQADFLINTQSPGEVHQFDGTEEELMATLLENPHFKVIKKKIPQIHLTTTIDKQLIVYDGISTQSKTEYPFIPIFCFHESSYVDDVSLKIQGLIRSLKDAQREKNKRRSAIQQAINTMPHSGFMVPNNSVDDINTLRNSAGPGKIIKYNAQKGKPEPIMPPPMPSSIMQLEMMFGDDIKHIGANPDMLGMQQGKNDPGITIQLRQRQGLTSLQEIFDSYSYAKRMLGRIIIDLIGDHFSNGKIKRILGDYLPYDMQKAQMVEQIKQIREEMQQIKPPTTAGMIPENQEDQIALQQVENQKLAAQNQIMAMEQEIARLQDGLQEVDQEEAEFWAKFDELRVTARFDVAIDETANSPTSRVADLASLTQSAQYGVPIPPEAIVELLDVSKNMKERIMGHISQQKQMQMQMAQASAPPPAPPPGADAPAPMGEIG